MNFKSNAAYKAWLAHGHASGEFTKTPGHQPVSIKGKSHNVQHNMGGMLYAAGGSFNNPGFAALPLNVQNKIRTNSFVNGGTMDQLTEFKEGGKHEENPLGGIPQGRSRDGKLNLVEEGEVKRKPTAEGGGNDAFIYSDSITVDKKFAKLYAIPKSFIGKTYAEAAKLAARPDSRRENDTIEQADIKRKIDSIAAAQEAQKAEAQREEKAKELAANPQLLDALMGQLATNQSVQPMGMPQGEQVGPDQVPQELLAQMEGAQQGMPIMKYGGSLYTCGGKMYDLGGVVRGTGTVLEKAAPLLGMASNFVIPGSGAFVGGALGGLGAGLENVGTGANWGEVTKDVAFGAGIGAIGGIVPGGGAAAGALTAGQMAGQAALQAGAGILREGENVINDNTTDASEQKARQREESIARANEARTNPNVGVATAGIPMYPNFQQGTVAKQGGYLPSYHQYPHSGGVGFANNAGPMGQPLTNLYAPGGTLGDTPMPPDNAPAGTPFNLADRNSWMGKYTIIPTGHDLTLPLSSLPGLSDQISKGLAKPNYKTVGEYVTAAENWERTSSGGLSPGPVTLIPPATSASIPPSTAVSTDPSKAYFIKGPSNENKWVDEATYNLFKGAKTTMPLDASGYPVMSGSGGKRFTEYDKSPTGIPAYDSSGTFAMGGSIETFNPNISNSFNAEMPVRKLYLGGPEDDFEDFLKQQENKYSLTGKPRTQVTSNKVSDSVFEDPYALSSEETIANLSKQETGNELEQAQLDMNNAETDEEFNSALEKYQSLLQRLDEELTDQNVDMSIGIHPLALAAMAAPAAVNIGRGLFGKPMQLNYKDYMSNANIQAPEFNINPQLADANSTFATATAAAKNASISGGNYANYLRELANMRNKTKGELYAQKENIDAENKMKADMANAEINRQNLASRYNIDMANAQALAAKHAMLSTGLGQVADIGKAAIQTAADKTLLKTISPTFANSLNLELLSLLKKDITNKEGK